MEFSAVRIEPNPLPRRFAALLQRIAASPSPELEFVAQAISALEAEGHVCLPLREITPELLAQVGVTAPAVPFEQLSAALCNSGVVGRPGDFAPLILDEKERLYLQRFWKYEQAVAQNLQRRARATVTVSDQDLRAALAAVCRDAADLQKLAAIIAARSNLCVISGATGTGKTRTIIFICALLVTLSRRSEIEIALAAPTGKAAARLQEALQTVPLPAQFVERLPKSASTIQRLLGPIGDSPKFRHNSDNQLTADVVIVDEASMIDLALLAKLLAAVRSDARVILVGDKDQLASVEAGSAFRDICTPGFDTRIAATQAAFFEKIIGKKLTGTEPRRAAIHDCIIELRENYRFANNEAIARASSAIKTGDATAATSVLDRGGEVRWQATPPAARFERALRDRVLPHFERLLKISEPAAALAQLREFAVLCALRRGPFGAENVNRRIEQLLHESTAIDRGQRNYHGQPVLITRNDYEMQLFNGDLGIVLRNPTEGTALRVFFAGENGELRAFAPARLPDYELAFALTVHKSQGSEFDHALVILPDQDTPVLTRELLYTAVTRVRRTAEIWSPRTVLTQTIQRRTRRSSGLRDALWGEVS